MRYSNNGLAYEFSCGATKGENYNETMFIADNTIYSYGFHFPIAKRMVTEKGIFYLFNNDSYSVTTARHKSNVLHYLKRNGDKIIFLNFVTSYRWGSQNAYKFHELKTILKQEKINEEELKLLEGMQKKRFSKARAERIEFLKEQQKIIKEFKETEIIKNAIKEEIIKELQKNKN